MYREGKAMLIGKKELIKASNIMVNYLLELEDNEIIDLIEGKKIISLIEKNEATKEVEVQLELDLLEDIKKVEKLDEVTEDDVIIEAINKIKKFTTREEAKIYLNQRIFTMKVLKIIAKKSNISFKSKIKKDEIIDKIIETTVVVALKHKKIGFI